MTQLWLSPEEAYRPCGYKDKQSLYRDIRLGKFPFVFVRAGKRIKISARSIGLTSAPPGAETNEAREGDQSLATATPAHACGD